MTASKKGNPLRLTGYACLIWLTVLAASCRSRPGVTQIIPEEDTSFLQIPGVGWQTFYKTADQDSTLDGLPFRSGTAYIRWYWVKLEPEEGKYAFDMVDRMLERCRKNNQALAFRIMCEDPWGEGLPDWLIKKGIRRTYTPCPQEGAHYAPDMSDTVFMYYHRKLIRAFGERYDGHPDLALVDIGSVGLWGEWHIYCDPKLMPDRKIRREITDLYFEVFPNTPLTALADDTTNVKYAVSKGRCGWRGDSWGNAAAPGVEWNHHDFSYWPTHRRVPEAWKTGTVAMEPGEPGQTMDAWVAPVETIVNDAISWHATFAQNKSVKIPDAYLPEIERLVKKIGFRLVLRSLTFKNSAPAGSAVSIGMKFVNLGIAPPYRDHRIAFRLRAKDGAITALRVTDLSIRGWLPGEITTTAEYIIPAETKPGSYALETGVVFHSAPDHVIPLADKGKTEDGWYGTGEIRITSQE